MGKQQQQTRGEQMNEGQQESTIGKDIVESVGSSDPWIHRAKGMICSRCMYFCNMRCRRHAPTMSGYPAVFESDWCGDHKLDKKLMGGK